MTSRKCGGVDPRVKPEDDMCVFKPEDDA